jgi:hypothetical protein
MDIPNAKHSELVASSKVKKQAQGDGGTREPEKCRCSRTQNSIAAGGTGKAPQRPLRCREDGQLLVCA